MIQRIEKLKETILPKQYSICSEMGRLITESWKENDGAPDVIRTAKAQANLLKKTTIFIEDDQLIVGNPASKFMAAEYLIPSIWSREGIDALKKEGWDIPDDVEAEIMSLSSYWKNKNHNYRLIELADDVRLWPFIQSGWILPPFKDKKQASEVGYAASGLLGTDQFAFGQSPDNSSVEFGRVINRGSNQIIKEAEEELKNINFNQPRSLKKANFLQAAIIAHKAFISYANRFAELASSMAKEEKSPIRKKELETIAQTCRWVPGNKPRTFTEAIQYVWFLVLMLGGSRLCRFDQYMYPYYQNDIKEGRITDEDVLELLQCFRIKDMQMFQTSATAHREKWSGLAKWHNMAIGGVTPDGKDATNELSYLVLEAAMICRTPHHTISLRVHEGTPEFLMIKALELVRTGIGMPAFLGDKSYIDYLVSKGVPLNLARDYYPIVCVDANVPEGCANVQPMCANTIAFNFLLYNGIDPNTGKRVGPNTGEFEDFKTYDEMMKAFKEQYSNGMRLEAEVRSLTRWQLVADRFPDSFTSSLFSDGIKQSKSGYERDLPYQLYATMGSTGMINMADSFAAIKKLVFDEKKYTLKELKAALLANWQGDRYQDMRKEFLAAPKYGNDIDYVDLIAADLYQFYADTAATIDGPRGTKYNVNSLSISAHQPAGKLTKATPDGRYDGEILADASVSAAQGKDTHGPTALIKSAAKINQTPYQATLFNMKFHPSALKTKDDLLKLSHLIKTYFSMGGKHIQFNVVDRNTLDDAQTNPENHRNLIVRVAGYSAYFVQLSKGVQDEIKMRMEHERTN